jgi:hypothetical protein
MFKTQIDIWHLDLESFESITDFGKKVYADFRERENRLDYAILNTGVWNYEYQQAKTGYEMCLQVRCSSPSAPGSPVSIKVAGQYVGKRITQSPSPAVPLTLLYFLQRSRTTSLCNIGDVRVRRSQRWNTPRRIQRQKCP